MRRPQVNRASAAALIVLASALTLLAPEVRQMRAGEPAGGDEAPGGAEPAPVAAEAA